MAFGAQQVLEQATIQRTGAAPVLDARAGYFSNLSSLSTQAGKSGYFGSTVEALKSLAPDQQERIRAEYFDQTQSLGENLKDVVTFAVKYLAPVITMGAATLAGAAAAAAAPDALIAPAATSATAAPLSELSGFSLASGAPSISGISFSAAPVSSLAEISAGGIGAGVSAGTVGGIGYSVVAPLTSLAQLTAGGLGAGVSAGGIGLSSGGVFVPMSATSSTLSDIVGSVKQVNSAVSTASKVSGIVKAATGHNATSGLTSAPQSFNQGFASTGVPSFDSQQSEAAASGLPGWTSAALIVAGAVMLAFVIKRA